LAKSQLSRVFTVQQILIGTTRALKHLRLPGQAGVIQGVSKRINVGKFTAFRPGACSDRPKIAFGKKKAQQPVRLVLNDD
jgi:hypothetical protein